MRDIIKSIKEPEKEKGGLYIITYIDNNCNEYTSHITKEGYEVALMYDQFRKLGYDISLIEDFKDKIIKEWVENDSWNR